MNSTCGPQSSNVSPLAQAMLLLKKDNVETGRPSIPKGSFQPISKGSFQPTPPAANGVAADAPPRSQGPPHRSTSKASEEQPKVPVKVEPVSIAPATTTAGVTTATTGRSVKTETPAASATILFGRPHQLQQQQLQQLHQQQQLQQQQQQMLASGQFIAMQTGVMNTVSAPHLLQSVLQQYPQTYMGPSPSLRQRLLSGSQQPQYDVKALPLCIEPQASTAMVPALHPYPSNAAIQAVLPSASGAPPVTTTRTSTSITGTTLAAPSGILPSSTAAPASQGHRGVNQSSPGAVITKPSILTELPTLQPESLTSSSPSGSNNSSPLQNRGHDEQSQSAKKIKNSPILILPSNQSPSKGRNIDSRLKSVLTPMVTSFTGSANPATSTTAATTSCTRSDGTVTQLTDIPSASKPTPTATATNLPAAVATAPVTSTALNVGPAGSGTTRSTPAIARLNTTAAAPRNVQQLQYQTIPPQKQQQLINSPQATLLGVHPIILSMPGTAQQGQPLLNPNILTHAPVFITTNGQGGQTLMYGQGNFQGLQLFPLAQGKGHPGVNAGSAKASSRKHSKCRICGRNCSSKYSRDRHEKTHQELENRLDFVCEICGNGYTESGNLSRHMRKAHHCKKRRKGSRQSHLSMAAPVLMSALPQPQLLHAVPLPPTTISTLPCPPGAPPSSTPSVAPGAASRTPH